MPANNLVYLKPSFEELRNLTFDLYIKVIKSGWKQDVNLGVGRGGLFVLRIMQDYYIASGVKLPYSVVVAERYTGLNNAEGLAVRGIDESLINNRKVLVVDDVADQGYTLLGVVREVLKKGAQEVRTATVHMKRSSTYQPDFYVSVTDAWIIYPWELYETIRQIIEKMINDDPKSIYWELIAKANVLPEEVRKLNVLASTSGLPPNVRLKINEVAAYAEP
ncbi:MAG: phosphoribosyltransferase family protein [Conexivisphaerales archaeon]